MADEVSRINIEGLKPADIALLKDVAEAAAENAVKKTMIAMGLDPGRPLDAQADMVWLRATRERCEAAAGRTLFIVIGMVAAAGVAALWVGFKASLK